MNNTNNSKNMNFGAMVFAFMSGCGAFLHFISTTSFFGIRIDITAMDNTYGWVLLAIAAVGLFAGFCNSNGWVFLAGLFTLGVVAYGYWQVTGSGSQFVWSVSRTFLEQQSGFFALSLGGAGMIISSMI